jgi:hypothetical protein
MVYFEQHVIVPPETAALIQYAIRALTIIGVLLACSIFALALALWRLSCVLLVKDREQAVAHRDHQRVDGRKHE